MTRKSSTYGNGTGVSSEFDKEATEPMLAVRPVNIKMCVTSLLSIKPLGLLGLSKLIFAGDSITKFTEPSTV